MEALEALLTRRSVRAYEERMPAQELIDKVMEAGLYAASGKNMQTAIIVEVTNKEVRDRLSVINAEIMGVTSDPFYGAPVVLAVLSEKNSPNQAYMTKVCLFFSVVFSYVTKMCLKSPIPLLFLRRMGLYKVLDEDLSSFHTDPLV